MLGRPLKLCFAPEQCGKQLTFNLYLAQTTSADMPYEAMQSLRMGNSVGAAEQGAAFRGARWGPGIRGTAGPESPAVNLLSW